MTPDTAPDALRSAALDEALARALDARDLAHDPRRPRAQRLCNGFTELPATPLLLERYGATLLVHDYREPAASDAAQLAQDPLLVRVLERVHARLPWLTAGLCKVRRASDPDLRHGALLFGDRGALAPFIEEDGVRYALALDALRDASFYLDTRELRRWLREHSAGRAVLNTFAYTGSLGVAAIAGGARRVVQTDRNERVLAVARASSERNGRAVGKRDLLAGDFFAVTARLRREGALFDTVLLDPPFFSDTAGGRVDLERGDELARLVAKVRPLVGDGGALVVVNNGLYVDGAAFLRTLEEACEDGFAALEATLAVPDEVAGFSHTKTPGPHYPADPAPFTHPTKIAVLRLRRRDGRRA